MTWKDELCSEYDYLFGEHDLSEPFGENAIPLEKISVEDGWKEPVKRFLNLIDILQKRNCTESEKIQIIQIKQKFATVRVHVDYPEKLVFDIQKYIGRLQGECYMTCEICGQAHTNGISKETRWLRCICDDCKTNNHYD